GSIRRVEGDRRFRQVPTKPRRSRRRGRRLAGRGHRDHAAGVGRGLDPDVTIAERPYDSIGTDERPAMSDPINAENWAMPVGVFRVDEAPGGAPTGNVEGRRPVGPLQGCGQLWQKTYEVRIPGPTPEEVIATWKQRF